MFSLPRIHASSMPTSNTFRALSAGPGKNNTHTHTINPKIACVALALISTGAFWMSVKLETPLEYKAANGKPVDDES